MPAALKILGFKILDIKKNGGGTKGIFVFEDRPDRPQLVMGYFNGELTWSLKAYANAWSDLKGLVVEIEMERNHERRTL
jgi:hypothetical protein